MNQFDEAIKRADAEEAARRAQQVPWGETKKGQIEAEFRNDVWEAVETLQANGVPTVPMVMWREGSLERIGDGWNFGDFAILDDGGFLPHITQSRRVSASDEALDAALRAEGFTEGAEYAISGPAHYWGGPPFPGTMNIGDDMVDIRGGEEFGSRAAKPVLTSAVVNAVRASR